MRIVRWLRDAPEARNQKESLFILKKLSPRFPRRRELHGNKAQANFCLRMDRASFMPAGLVPPAWA